MTASPRARGISRPIVLIVTISASRAFAEYLGVLFDIDEVNARLTPGENPSTADSGVWRARGVDGTSTGRQLVNRR